MLYSYVYVRKAYMRKDRLELFSKHLSPNKITNHSKTHQLRLNTRSCTLQLFQVFGKYKVLAFFYSTMHGMELLKLPGNILVCDGRRLIEKCGSVTFSHNYLFLQFYYILIIPYVIIFYLLPFLRFKNQKGFQGRLGIFIRLKTCFSVCLSGIKLLRNNLSKIISSGKYGTLAFLLIHSLTDMKKSRSFTSSLLCLSLFMQIIISKFILSAINSSSQVQVSADLGESTVQFSQIYYLSTKDVKSSTMSRYMTCIRQTASGAIFTQIIYSTILHGLCTYSSVKCQLQFTIF